MQQSFDTTGRLLRFADLKRLGLVANWSSLRRWVDDFDFPPGRKLGAQRVWYEAEVMEWIGRQPTANGKLKGRAKALAAASRQAVR